MTSEFQQLIEPNELSERLGEDNLLIVDLCNAALYQQKHIPGAVHLPYEWLMSGTAPTPGKLPPMEQIQRVIDYLGIDNQTTVVLYDDEGGGWAGRLAWTLDLLGHSNWLYLNGGIVAWINEGYATEHQANIPLAKHTEIKLENITPRATREQITCLLDKENFAVWDARSFAEYCGDDIRARRGGHIPGAIHLEWTTLMDRQRNLRIRTDAQAILNKLGLTADKHIVTHCQSHHRSSFTYLVARLLGYSNISGYDGSWSEWGNSEDTAITLGPNP